MNAHDENYNCEHICFHHNFFFAGVDTIMRHIDIEKVNIFLF